MPARIGLLVAFTLLPTLGAAGCGGDDDDALTKEEFIAQANQACVDGDEEIDQAAEKRFGNTDPSRAEFKQFTLETVVPRVQTTIDEIRDLAAPEGDEDQINAFLDAVQADLDQVEEDQVEEDPLAIRSPQNDLFVEPDRLAREYGIEECAR